jgi:hypothetical protein
MICNECKKGKVVMHAFSDGKCEHCGCDVVTPHIPCDKLCENCSEKNNSCRECGVKIEDNKE